MKEREIHYFERIPEEEVPQHLSPVYRANIMFPEHAVQKVAYIAQVMNVTSDIALLVAIEAAFMQIADSSELQKQLREETERHRSKDMQ